MTTTPSARHIEIYEEIVQATMNKSSGQLDKGYIQLALRTGQYKIIGVREVRKSELKGVDQFTGDPIIEFNLDSQEEEIVGYYAYYELLSGARKTLYWPVSKLRNHGQKYSKTYTGGLWKYNFDDMAKKTMLKQLIGKWGIMSTELEMASKYDQAVVKNNGTPDYVDNPQQQITANTHSDSYAEYLKNKESEGNK